MQRALLRTGLRGVTLALALIASTDSCTHNGVTSPELPAVAFTLYPRDTVIVSGNDYRLRVSAVDSTGSSVRVVPSISIDGPAVAAGTRLTGREPGRVKIVATSGELRDSAFFTIVPDGTLLAARPDGIYAFRTDGSGLRRVAAAMSARSPRWLPDGRRFVFSVGLSHGYISDLSGNVSPLLSNSSALAAELWAHPSRDGQWVYFGGYDWQQFRGQPYRVRPDGTGMTLVPGFPSDNFTQGHPTPDPTGNKLAYFREEFSSRNVFIRVLDMNTGEFLVTDVPGHAPEWSHGDSIGYLDMKGGTSGPIRLMSSAGLGRRQIGSGETYDFGFDWSPDDRWIVATDLRSQRLEIIEVRTGLRLPLTYSAGYINPAWK